MYSTHTHTQKIKFHLDTLRRSPDGDILKLNEGILYTMNFDTAQFKYNILLSEDSCQNVALCSVVDVSQ
jgi:hypothetical protein